MQRNHNSIVRIGVGLGLIAVLIIGTILVVGRQASQPSSGLQVVAAENFWGNIAGQLGGSHVHVTSIITDPTADPHLYESNANNASAVASAKLVIQNGLGYDDFMAKLLQASHESGRRVLTAASILGISGTDANPHIWYDIPKVDLVAQAIVRQYEAIDPAHTADYQHNLARFETSLKPLLATINSIKQQYGGSPVAYTEPVPGYALAAAGLDVRTPETFAKAIEDGTDPSPVDAQTMDQLMTSRQVKVLLYNSQATSPVTEHVKQLARQSGVPVIGVSETLPAGQDYQSWQQSQLNALLKALQS